MAELKLTEEQRAVVENRGGNLLVSAAAGSGKTRVLVERIMARLEQGEDIDRFLVITFTNAAAAELRQRIAAAIHERLGANPNDRHLRRNATLVYRAQICTIDAFCMDFLRNWGHLAELDPDFRLCDQAEGEELRRQALTEVLERHYENIQNEPAFAALVDDLAGDRDDQTLEEVVLDIHRRVQAQPAPRKWLLDRRSDFALEGVCFEQTVWCRVLLDNLHAAADYWKAELEELRTRVNCDDLLEKNYGASLDATLEWLEKLTMVDRWDEAAGCYPGVFPDGGRKRGECDGALKEQVLDARKRCKAQLNKLGELFEITAHEAMEDLRAVGPAMTALLELTEEFDREFEILKRRRRLVDFPDCEHLTAALLTDENGAPTDLAREVGGQYSEIMVDEYQDTNGVQNAIFDALSNGYNLFMVGDVKQSIYRFRQADPTQFLEKYRRFVPYDEAAEGEERKILLSRNFRSRPEVLDGVNFIFGNCMNRASGELDYTEAEALRPGREDLIPDGRFRVELNCVDMGAGDEEGQSKDEEVACAAAARIRELLDEGFLIGERPIRPEDIVILIRSPGPVLRHYARALDAARIPWCAEGGYEFFGTTEISVAIAMLQIVDNPRQDVPLLAVLRSPLFAFTPDRLAQLRAGAQGSLYDCLAAAGERKETDCVEFLDLLEELRDLAAEESSDHLLWYLYDRTHLPAVFAAMAEGERRRANLMALHDEACRFESGGHKGLMAFLLHLSRMADNGVSVPVPGSDSGSGVRILSIHRSKGLEFPVVLLCGLERRFNLEDSRSTILFHPELGLGPKRTDRSRMLRYTTLAREAVSLHMQRQMRAEEMRLLYVAMTRAEHKLILFSAVNTSGVLLKNLAPRARCPLPAYAAANAASMADWVLLTALCRPDSDALWAGLDTGRPEPDMGAFGWDIHLLPPAGLPQVGVREEDPEEGPELPEDLAEQLNWRYEKSAAADIPSKLTATQLKGRAVDRETAEEGAELRPEAPSLRLRRPCFDGERPLTAAEKGTALHMAMQYLDYERTDSPEEIREELTRLREKQFLTPQQAEAVDPGSIWRFFRSHVGRRLRKARRMEREFKFSMLAPAADFYPEAAGLEDQVLLQGVVDCWFTEEDGTVTVLDFKTDLVSEETVGDRAESYRGQLDAYARALSLVLGQTVGKRLLWFFSLDREVEV